MPADYYTILGIDPRATPEEVRAAYRRLAKQHPPDAGGDAEEFRAIQKAYKVLMDPVRRRQYDAERDARFPIPKVAEPVIPSWPRQADPWRSSRISGFRSGETVEDFDRFFRAFDEFFERLEQEFLGLYWGRNE